MRGSKLEAFTGSPDIRIGKVSYNALVNKCMHQILLELMHRTAHAPRKSHPPMKKHFSFLMLVAVAAALCAGCATKIPYRNVKSQLPPIKAGDARVYFYTLESSGMRFFLKVDGKKVGFVENRECLYTDHPAGNCKLTVTMAGMFTWKDLTLNLLTGETQYVQVETAQHLFGPGSCRLIQMDPDQGAPDLDQCFFMKSNTQ